MIRQNFKRDSIQTIPWRNGGGLTREIAASSPEEGFWRLSIADVGEEGAFSPFPGLQRILTVIEGEGMELRLPAAVLSANKYVPLVFSGDEQTMGVLPYGAIQDFNLIFDPQIWDGQVNVGCADDITSLHWCDADITAIYCLEGRAIDAEVGMLERHSGAVLKPGELALVATGSCKLLCVDLRLKS